MATDYGYLIPKDDYGKSKNIEKYKKIAQGASLPKQATLEKKDTLWVESKAPNALEKSNINYQDKFNSKLQAPVKQDLGDKIGNFFKVTVPNAAEDIWDNIKEPFVGKSTKQLMTEAKLSPKLLVEDAKKQMEKENPTREDYALVKQTQDVIKKYGTEESNIRAISEDTTKLQEDLKSAEKTWQVSPVDATLANTGAAAVGIFGNLGSFANSLGADKVPLLREVTNFAVNGAKKAQENAQQYNRGNYGEALGTVTQGIVNLVPYFLIGTGTTAMKGATTVTKYGKYIEPIIKNPSFWYSLTSMWGQKYQEKLDEGYNRFQALGNAILYALPASLIEVSGGIGAQGKEAQSLMRTMGEEIAEEIAQDIMSGISDKITTNHDLPVFSTTEDAIINPKELGKTALYTAPIVAIGGGANNVINKNISNRAENQKAQAQINQDLQNLRNQNPQNVNSTIQRENVTGLPKLEAQNQAQTQNIEQPNVTLPTQAEMAQNANMNQIRDNTKLIAQRDKQALQSAKNDNFYKGLERFNSKKYTQTDDMIVLDETPQYLYNLGFDADKPLVINMSKLETIMKEPKGTFDGKNQHGITMDVVEQLPKALQNPLNVIKNPKHNERVVVVTELTDQYGDIIIVPIEMNTDGYIENIENNVNRINTVYGKENYDIPKEGNDKGYIQYNEDKIIYDIDKDITKKRDINSDYRLQLPSTAINISNNSINQNDSSVNTEYAQNNTNDTADTQSAFSMPKNSLLNEIAPIDEKQLENVEEKETTASILTKSPKRPAKDLLKQSVDVVMRKLVDAGNTINTVGKLTGDKHLYEYFNNTKQARQSAEYMIGEAQTDIKGNRVGNSLIRIFEEVRAKGDTYTNEFFEYLLHMHNIDRMAQNKPVFGESVKAEDSRRIANQLLEKHPEFEKQANKVYAYNRNLMQWRVDSGLISKEQADLMNEMYPHYVPTFRDVSGTSGSRTMQNTVQIANTVRKATGSNKDIMPIDASMARQTMQTVQAAKRNLLGNRLLNDALNNKDKVGEYIQVVEKTTEQNDLETELDTPKDTNLDSNNNVFKIFRNGETYVMQVNNGIYEGLKSISSEIDNTDTNLLLKPVKAANNMFKKLITGYSPMFTIKNFARDIQDAGLYSKNLRGFLKKYPKAYQEMMGNGKMWQLYKSLGGTGSSFFDYETGIEKTLDTQNKTSTKIKDATLGKVEELNMMIEQAPRFAEFMATIEKVGNQNYDTLMEAMLNAADITVNFGRSGTWGKALNSTAVPFFNPSIQGFDKFTRTVLESKDGKKVAKLILRASLLGILPSVLNELLYSDDDEYENLTDRDKDTNFLIKTADNKWIKIPKGRVLSIFGNTATRALRTAKGEEWDFGEYAKNQASQTAPISVFDSNLYSPIQAVKNNKTWYGSDIVPQRLQDYAPKDQYDENTDVFSKWLGSKINYSPKKINYLIDAYTGVIGDVVLPLTTPKAETNPFTKAFVLDGVTSNEISNDFYNMLDKYNPKQNPKKSAKEVSRYLNKQSSQVSDIYKQIREVENSDISDDEKRKQVREFRELANTIELTAMATVPEYEKAVDKYRGTFADEDVDSDYAYLFANRDIFGAEYAVKTFSKSLYNNHKDENMNTFFKNYFTREYFQKKLEPKETTKTSKNTLPTLSQQRAKLPTLKK